MSISSLITQTQAKCYECIGRAGEGSEDLLLALAIFEGLENVEAFSKDLGGHHVTAEWRSRLSELEIKKRALEIIAPALEEMLSSEEVTSAREIVDDSPGAGRLRYTCAHTRSVMSMMLGHREKRVDVIAKKVLGESRELSLDVVIPSMNYAVVKLDASRAGERLLVRVEVGRGADIFSTTLEITPDGLNP